MRIDNPKVCKMLSPACILVLCVVAAHSDSTISWDDLWGVRLVATPSGPHGPMLLYRTSDAEVYATLKGDLSWNEVKFHNNDSCTVKGVVIGNPCKKVPGYVNITVVDASEMSEISVYETNMVLSGAYFYPNCTFPDPVEDELAINYSFPYSRFEGDKKHALVNYGIWIPDQLGDYPLTVKLLRDGKAFCNYTDFTPSGPECGTVEHLSSGYAIYHLNITKGKENRTWLFFGGTSGFVAHTIDWTKQGYSPEVGECYKYHQPNEESGPDVSGPVTETTSIGHDLSAGFSMALILVAIAY